MHKMSAEIGLVSVNDDFIDNVVAHADPMVLRGALFLQTGDEDLLAVNLESKAEQDEISAELRNAEDKAMLRVKASTFLRALRDGKTRPAEPQSPEQLRRSLGLTAGFEIPSEEQEIWFQEAAIDQWARGIKWSGAGAPKARENYLVAVIGTGLCGLNAAAQLKRAGIPFVVIEKNPEVGGAWFENQYPGARVDSASRGYTHSFGVNYPYPYAYCPQGEVLNYLKWVTSEFGLRDSITFNTEVTSMAWDDHAQMWDIAANGPDGRKTWRVNAVISCVGFLSRPKMPDIEGMDTFQGTACHSAEWPDGLDVAGKRVAVIGSGATGYQTLPVIARTASHAYLFQRTPSWLFHDPNYLKQVPEEILWLEKNFPYYSNFARFRLTATRNPNTARVSTRFDPEFRDPHAGSALNKKVRDACIAFLEKSLAGRPDLIEKMIPPTPPMSTRPIRIDSEDNVLKAIQRDNVTLVSGPIDRITPAGVVSGGKEYETDIIVYATGFRANDYLWPMEIRGRDGVRIEEVWEKDGPRAYLGSMVPGFPNLFMAYGPNTNNFGGFQVMDLLELVTQFGLRCISGMIEQNIRSIDVATEAYWRFAEELDREEALMLYKHPQAQSYYTNEHGRSAVNNPIDTRRLWRWMNDPAGKPPAETDAGMRPYFGEDLRIA